MRRRDEADAAKAAAAGTHRRHTNGELDLAERAHLGRAGRAIHRQSLEIDGGGDVVAAADVGRQVRQQVPASFGRSTR
jgi:hypothetical protein